MTRTPGAGWFAYGCIFILTLDLVLPFILGLFRIGWWTPIVLSFCKGAHVGWATWPPPELAIRDAVVQSTGQSAGKPGFIFGSGIRHIFSGNTLAFYMIYTVGFAIADWRGWN